MPTKLHEYDGKENAKIEVMVEAYCKSAHVEDFENDKEKEKSLRKQIKPLLEILYEKQTLIAGQENLTGIYEVNYKNLKSETHGLGDYAKVMLKNVDDCVKGGHPFHVSSLSLY